MPGRKMLCLGVTVLSLLIADVSRAQHGHMHGAGSHYGYGAGASVGAVGGYPGFYAIPYFAVGPFGMYGYYPGIWTGGFGNAPFGSMLPAPMPMRGPVIASPPPRLGGQRPQGANKPARAPSDPARANQSITVGDRLFRAGNLKKAEERYQQALRGSRSRRPPSPPGAGRPRSGQLHGGGAPTPGRSDRPARLDRNRSRYPVDLRGTCGFRPTDCTPRIPRPDPSGRPRRLANPRRPMVPLRPDGESRGCLPSPQ